MKVLVIGATGMLGYSLFSNLGDYSELDVYGTVRNINGKEIFFKDKLEKLITNVDVNESSSLKIAIEKLNPNIVINCIGLIKQHSISKQHCDAISINALLPHKIAGICDEIGAKLIHFSTDCVFTGDKGNYSEADLPDAQDLYGKSKCLGEVAYAPHLTLRTSIIGHELSTSVSLIDWFLSQSDSTKGFSKAVFSGLPTCVIAKIIAESIIPKTDITGLYQLSVEPIDKYSLLKLVSEIYEKEINIEPSENLVIDRSLNSTRLRNKLGFQLLSWRELITAMNVDYIKRYQGIACKN